MRNLKINKKTGKSELELRCDFYPEHILRKTAKDFRKIFNVNIEKMGGKYIVTLKSKENKIEIEKATYEFMNYLLAEVKNEAVRL
jgi:hypothetical protein